MPPLTVAQSVVPTPLTTAKAVLPLPTTTPLVADKAGLEVSVPPPSTTSNALPALRVQVLLAVMATVAPPLVTVMADPPGPKVRLPRAWLSPPIRRH